MSDLVLLAIGGGVFALTTSASVFVGGLKLSRIIEREREQMAASEPVPVRQTSR